MWTDTARNRKRNKYVRSYLKKHPMKNWGRK